MIDNRRIPWAGIGVLAISLLIVPPLCCLCLNESPTPPPPPCDVPPPPVVVPAPDAGESDVGLPCDAAPAPGALSDASVDAGASCGSHPWCPHPKPCCLNEQDCCSS